LTISTLLKQFFIKKAYMLVEQQLYAASKEVLEIYIHNLGLNLDKKCSKSTLVKQILAQQKYSE
jgi:translation elongation factor EF-Ts